MSDSKQRSGEPVERYTTLAGETLEYLTPAPEVAAFLARVVEAVHDPTVTEATLTELVYGKANPLLDQTILPHHGVVTKAVFADPVYHVILDLLGRKRATTGRLDVAKALEEYTVTVTEAARQLGVHPSAVRQAIQQHRLDAVKRGGVHLLRPSSVESYRVSRRGPRPAPALAACVGNVPGASCRIKIRGGALEVEERDSATVTGSVARFERVAVLTSTGANQRLFVLEPADEQDQLAFPPFWVRGRFRVVAHENNARRARDAWKAFETDTEVTK
jgi:excisionase family DNA binding protein